MDNKDSQNPHSLQDKALHSSSTVVLDSRQYFRYQTDHIDIHAPDGRDLETLSKAKKNDAAEDAIYRVRDQLALVTCLIGNINDPVNLTTPAVLGLSDLLGQVQMRWDKR